MKSWFVSDIHLKSIQERSSQILLRFLLQLQMDPKNNQLFLLGDIFDFWVGDGKAFYHHYKDIVDAIIQFKESGGQVYYFEGNHDFHIDHFWKSKANITVIKDFDFFNIDGLIVRCEHGDFINPNDKNYLNYREKIRTPFIYQLAHSLPGVFIKWLGDYLSSKSRKKSKNYAINNQNEIIKMIRLHAESMHSQKRFDLIITGHMHVQDDFYFKEKKMQSINLGTWLHQPVALKIEKSNIEWVNLF